MEGCPSAELSITSSFHSSPPLQLRPRRRTFSTRRRSISIKLCTHCELPESGCHLLVVALRGRDAVLLNAPLSDCVEAADEVVQHRRGDHTLVCRTDTLLCIHANLLLSEAHGEHAVDEGLDEPLSGRAGVPPKHDARLDGQVNLEHVHQVDEHGDQVLRGGCVGDGGRVGLPGGLEHLSLGVDELDAVVGSWVVRRGDHHSDRLAANLLGAENSEESHSVESTWEQRRPASGERIWVSSERDGASEEADGGDDARFVLNPAVPNEYSYPCGFGYLSAPEMMASDGRREERELIGKERGKVRDGGQSPTSSLPCSLPRHPRARRGFTSQPSSNYLHAYSDAKDIRKKMCMQITDRCKPEMSGKIVPPPPPSIPSSSRRCQ